MKSVLMRLEGPLQSWGTQGRFELRDTDREPSKSGVIGLVGAALGMDRADTDLLARLAKLELAVRVDREGRWMRDYHTVGGGVFRGSLHGLRGSRGVVAVTERHYLADASFLAALGGDDDALVEQVASALRQPRWPLYLGRRACPPSAGVFEDIVEAAPRQAVASAPAPHWMDDGRSDSPRQVRVIYESSPAEGSARQDVPLSFDSKNRRHGLRYVSTEIITLLPPS